MVFTTADRRVTITAAKASAPKVFGELFRSAKGSLAQAKWVTSTQFSELLLGLLFL